MQRSRIGGGSETIDLLGPSPTDHLGLDGATSDLDGLPHHQIVRELGRGGMGVVYLARNTLMDRLEVLKVLNRHFIDQHGTSDRFLREIRAAGRLSHPNVVTAFSAAQSGPSFVFAMEYVEGYDLAQLVEARGPLPVLLACSFAHQAALGLQHAHERGMVHRDIKPGNLMLTRQAGRGIVKILDFGLAKASREQTIDANSTQDGQMMGTPGYIAPEQTIDAGKADIRADIYGLGCTLYYLLTGRPPFGGGLLDLIMAHRSSNAQPVFSIRPEVPEALSDVVARMMAKRPEDRYQTPAEVAKALLPFFKKAASQPVAAEDHQAPVVDQDRWATLIDFKAAEPEGLMLGLRREHKSRWRGVVPAVLVAAGVAGLMGWWPIRRPHAPLKDPGSQIAATAPGPANVRWTPLFNGKDLAGWETYPDQPSGWRVEKGILTGSGRRISFLRTVRNDFDDFHLRVEARINAGGEGGLCFRAGDSLVFPRKGKPYHPDCYEAEIHGVAGHNANTGSIYFDEFSPPMAVSQPTIVPGRWFVLEVIARGTRLKTRIDGKDIVDFAEPKGRLKRGHIALQQSLDRTVIEFRKIEISRDLPPDDLDPDQTKAKP